MFSLFGRSEWPYRHLISAPITLTTYTGGEFLICEVNFEDGSAAFDVWRADVDLSVESPRAQQGVVESVEPVRRRHHHHAVVDRVKAVHLRQNLVQSHIT